MGSHPPDQVTGTVYWTQFPAHALSGTNWDDHANAHASIMRLFPTQLDGPAQQRRAHAGILYRFDTHSGQPPTVLVQSFIPPELTPAEARTMTVPDHVWDLPAGTRVGFRVTLCPIRRHKPPKGTPGRERTIPVPHDELEAWTITKLSPAITDMQILNIATRTSHTNQSRNAGQPPRINLATVDGLATVHNPQAHTHLRTHGIGRAKAYGAGLLTTRPL